MPGGGIEDNESIEEVLCRETLEETGFMIKNVKAIRLYKWKRHTGERISYFYISDTDNFVGTKYEAKKIAEKFEPEWMDINVAISKLAEEGELLAKRSDKPYNGMVLLRIDEIWCYWNSSGILTPIGGIINCKLSKRN